MPRACSSSLLSMYLWARRHGVAAAVGWLAGGAAPVLCRSGRTARALARGTARAAPNLARQPRVDEPVGSHQVVGQRGLAMVHVGQHANVSHLVLVWVRAGGRRRVRVRAVSGGVLPQLPRAPIALGTRFAKCSCAAGSAQTHRLALQRDDVLQVGLHGGPGAGASGPRVGQPQAGHAKSTGGTRKYAYGQQARGIQACARCCVERKATCACAPTRPPLLVACAKWAACMLQARLAGGDGRETWVGCGIARKPGRPTWVGCGIARTP